MNNDLETVKWKELNFEDDNFFFVPKDFSLKEEYEKGFKVNKLFQSYRSGVTTADDKNLVSFTSFKENNYQYALSPFDTRFINYDLKKVQRPRYEIMQHFVKGKNIGLITRRTVENTKKWQQIFVSNNMVEGNYLSARTYVFPLYQYKTFTNSQKADDNKIIKTVNLNKEIADKLTAKVIFFWTIFFFGAVALL